MIGVENMRKELMRSHDYHSQALGCSRENCVMTTTLTPTEHRALTALRKWCHRDSPLAAECDRLLAAGECVDDDQTLIIALSLYANEVTTPSPTQHEKG